MKKFVLASVCMLFMPILLAAGEGSWELQGGYGVFRADGKDVGQPYTLHGWDAGVTHFFSPKLGLTARVSSGYGEVRYREEIIDTSGYAFLVGPTFKLRREKLEPFAHALFASYLIRADRGSYTATGLEFGTALGAGLDYKAWGRFSLRAVQFDYVLVRAEGTTAHNFKVGAGLVVNF